MHVAFDIPEQTVVPWGQELHFMPGILELLLWRLVGVRRDPKLDQHAMAAESGDPAVDGT